MERDEWIKYNSECVNNLGGEEKINDEESLFKFVGKVIGINIEEKEIEIEEGIEKCPRCESLRTIATETQKRSADEGMTCNFTCASCKHVW